MVKGRLRQNAQFWYNIGSSQLIMSVIMNGYTIPFFEIPPPMFFRNNKSALNEKVSVTESIMELLSSHRILEKTEPSFIVSPLSVAYQATGKKRLILDLSRLNKFVQKAH